MAGPTAADVWRCYIKPAMDGRLIIRKKGVIRRSLRVIERNRMFAATKPAVGCGRLGPAGAPTPWKQFVSCLRAKAAPLRTRAPTAAAY